MKEIKIHIAGKTYKVQLAETDEDKEKGLQGVTDLPVDSGMLFIFDNEDIDIDQPISFWMKDTSIPLDIAFIDENMVVTKTFQGIPYSEEMMEGNANYVLEVNQGSGIKVGDELDFSPSNKKVKNTEKMLVLDSEGDVQMELDGGERIFSRKNTKTLIKFAKKAATTDYDNDYRTLGKRMFKFLQKQNNTAPEYVESKN